MTKTNDKTKAALEKKIRVAINELDQEGKHITNANVREKSGGSFREVGPIVKAIKAEREARAVAESQVPAMPEDVAELTTALWEAAYRAADATAAAERRAHAEQIKSLQDDLAERETELGIIEDERDVAFARAETAEREAVELGEAVVQMKISGALLEGRVAGLLEALQAQTSGVSDETQQGAIAAEAAGENVCTSSDDAGGTDNAPIADNATSREAAPDRGGKDASTGKARAGKSFRPSADVDGPETADLPGINLPGSSDELGSAA